MRLLHMSDLHYGATWRGFSRRADQDRVLAEILAICESERVDALLVAGDVFSDRPDGPAADVIRRLLQQLRPLLERSRPVFLLRGNHDSLPWFRLLRLLTVEMGGADRWPLVVADLPGVYRLPGHALQIVALPHLSARQLQTEALDAEISPDRQVESLEAALGGYIGRLCRGVSADEPAIFAAHFLVGGAKLNEKLEAEAGYHRDIWLRTADLPQLTSYNAFGHIHLAQEISGVGKPTVYSGAPDRLDIGEREYAPRVVLVDVPPRPGGVAEVTSVPLTTCSRFIKTDLVGAEAVQAFIQEAQASAFGGLTVGEVTLGEIGLRGIDAASRTAIIADLERVVPRVQTRRAQERVAPESRLDDFAYEDVPGVVREYLQQAYAEQPDRRTRLLSAFDSLWDAQRAAVGGAS